MIRRSLSVWAALAALTLLAVVTASPSSAAPYPPSNPASLTASAYDPCAGASNSIGGNGFQAGETVSLRLGGTGEIGRPVVGADGRFELTITVPDDARGTEQVTAVGLTSGLTAGFQLAISDCSAPASDGGGAGGGAGSLASTGVAVGGALLAVIVLVGVGATLVVVGRRRRDGVTTG